FPGLSGRTASCTRRCPEQVDREPSAAHVGPPYGPATPTGFLSGRTARQFSCRAALAQSGATPFFPPSRRAVRTARLHPAPPARGAVRPPAALPAFPDRPPLAPCYRPAGAATVALPGWPGGPCGSTGIFIPFGGTYGPTSLVP